MAAKVAEVSGDRSVWVHIRPIVDPAQTWDSLREQWAVERSSRVPFRRPTAFVFRYVSLSQTHLEAEDRGDLDLALREEPADDWEVFVPDEEMLGRVLSVYLRDFDALRIPADVGYPDPPPEFAKAKSLREVLGAA